MKCPLFVLHVFQELGKTDLVKLDCLKEQCAWWLEDVNLCSLKELALETRYTQFRLQELINKKGG